MQCSNARLLLEVATAPVISAKWTSIIFCTIAHPTRVISWKLAPVLGVEKVGAVSSIFDASSRNLSPSGWKWAVNYCSFLKYNSAFRIVIRKHWGSSFVICIGKIHIFMSHNAAAFLWTSDLSLPAFKSWLNAGIVLLSKATQWKWKLSWSSVCGWQLSSR